MAVGNGVCGVVATKMWTHTISRTHSSNKNTKQKWETKQKSTSLLNRVSQVQPMISGGVRPSRRRIYSSLQKTNKEGQGCNTKKKHLFKYKNLDILNIQKT